LHSPAVSGKLWLTLALGRENYPMKRMTRIPTNAKNIAFCFFEGSVLSVPFGMAFSKIRPFTPPEWTEPLYISIVLFSALALFIWSLMSFRDQPFLACIGLITSLCFVGAGLLFPAL
jgi:hypothetical protein